MALTDQETAPGQLTVTNIGGIDHAEITIQPGVTVLSGENATNRTSLLTAVMATLGSDRVRHVLKADADHGEASFAFDATTYTRTFTRDNGTLRVTGDPYLEDPTAVDLFAFLVEDNPARAAVRQNADLRDLIMEPVDTEALEAEIANLQEELRDVDEELDHLDQVQSDLDAARQRKAELDAKIESLDEELEELEADLEAKEATVEESGTQQEKRDEKLTTLQDLQRERERVSRQLSSHRETLETLTEDRDQVKDDLEALPEASDDVGAINAELERVEERRESLERALTQLRSVLEFNRELVSSENSPLQTALDETTTVSSESELSADAGDLMEELVGGSDEVICWTCGSAVDRETIEETLANVSDARDEIADQRNALTADIEELKDRRQSIIQQRDKREELTEKLADLNATIDSRKEKIDTLEEKQESLETDIADLEAELEELEADQTADNQEVLSLHKEYNELEVKLESLKDERADVTDTVQDLTEELERESDLRDRREELQADLQERRSRIRHLEEEAVEAFNDQMETVLELLGYENLERIWLERHTPDDDQPRGTATAGSFTLHVVRETADGTVYEDTLVHLSESEREVTGLVFALAGYLAHDVHESCPVMVIDSIEAIDPGRLGDLIDHFSAYVDYLLVSALPEAAADLSDTYTYLTPPFDS